MLWIERKQNRLTNSNSKLFPCIMKSRKSFMKVFQELWMLHKRQMIAKASLGKQKMTQDYPANNGHHSHFIWNIYLAAKYHHIRHCRKEWFQIYLKAIFLFEECQPKWCSKTHIESFKRLLVPGKRWECWLLRTKNHQESSNRIEWAGKGRN